MMEPTVLAAGYRGTAFVSGVVARGLRPRRLISYRQVGDHSEAFQRLADLARSEGIAFEEARHPDLSQDALVFVIGWQFLIEQGAERCIVFHDSLLPTYRGFAPTVTALLRGDNKIGVPAFQPDAGVDPCSIYGQRSVQLPPYSSLRSVLDLQTSVMVDLALELASSAERGNLRSVAQDESSVSSSLWRDAFDFFIDWRQDAAQILRHIACVGSPYQGAKAVLPDRVLTITKARPGADIPFAIRDPGKVWQIDNGRALVVCGAGTIWID